MSAEKIIGSFLKDRDVSPLIDLARSGNLWERRIAIISTFHFIKNGDAARTFAIAKILIDDEHDLIHKAVGWMLREVGKRDQDILALFLKTHYSTMPRTMLRYAIEKFSPEQREAYLEGKV